VASIATVQTLRSEIGTSAVLGALSWPRPAAMLRGEQLPEAPSDGPITMLMPDMRIAPANKRSARGHATTVMLAVIFATSALMSMPTGTPYAGSSAGQGHEAADAPVRLAVVVLACSCSNALAQTLSSVKMLSTEITVVVWRCPRIPRGLSSR
jgi:hypothetical protein